MSELLPTGTVTLLLADVEGSTRLWETQPDEMTAAFAKLDRTLAGGRMPTTGCGPIEQGEGDSFVIAFGRASDAVACALEVQRSPLGPIRLRIGVHTGEVQLRDEANYIGPTINRTARIRDLAHGGQTGVIKHHKRFGHAIGCPPMLAGRTRHASRAGSASPRTRGAALPLRHPQRTSALRTSKAVRSHNLPAQLTTFGRPRRQRWQRYAKALNDNRLVTLTGAGGAGKTRLAIEIAAQLIDEFRRWCLVCRPVADYQSRRRAGDGSAHLRSARPTGPLTDGDGACGSSVTERCCCCSTTASTCSTRPGEMVVALLNGCQRADDSDHQPRTDRPRRRSHLARAIAVGRRRGD